MSDYNGLKDFSKQFRDKILKYKLPTPPDVIEGLAETHLSTTYESYLSGVGLDTVLSDLVNKNPGSINDHEKYRNEIMAKNGQTPTDIADGLTNLRSDPDSLVINYLDSINRQTVLTDNSAIEPSSIDDHSKYREKILKKNEQTPRDIVEGVNELTQSQTYAANYIDDINKQTEIGDKLVANPGSVDDHSEYREKNLKKNLEIQPEILIGLNELSQTQMTTKNFLDNIDKPTYISDNAVLNAGSLDSESTIREKMMTRNQKIQTDIVAGLTELSETKSSVRNYIDTVNNPTVISDLVVNNPGDAGTIGNQQRYTNLSRNRKIDTKNDVSDGGSSLVDSSITNQAYTNWLYDIGKEAKIGDYMAINQDDLDTDNVKDPISGVNVDKNLILATKRNLYKPSDGYNIFDDTITELKIALKANKGGFWTEDMLNGFQPKDYSPADFIQGIKTDKDGNPLYDFSNVAAQSGFLDDSILGLVNNEYSLFKSDSLMMNIAALQLQFNLTSRIQEAMLRETLLKSKLDEALTNPLAAIDIIKNPQNSLFEKNYQISVSANPVGAAIDLVGRLTGTLSSNELFGLGEFLRDKTYSDTLVPKILPRVDKTKRNNAIKSIYNDITGSSIRSKDRDAWLLARTGDGQKANLFQNIAFNKYQPDYIPEYETGIANGFFSIIKGISGFLGLADGDRPAGRYYLGKKDTNDPIDILQQNDGFYQQNSNEALTNSFAEGYLGENAVKIGNYGILTSEFMWLDEAAAKGISPYDTNLNQTTRSYGIRDTFREGSLLDFTQKMVERDTIVGQTINQVNKKFTDGYTTISRGSNVKSYPDVIDSTGRRNYAQMLNNGELCRVWTKDRPYGNITTTMKYSELIRRERNSVLDRYNNLNIFPSALNVNSGYGNPLLTSSGKPIVTEYYGENRARKYMFSIENLAWKDSSLERSLPPSEKGPNGGRIMWFPPYDISISDNNSANWTSTTFLGRPEPVYTYNNSERTGQLTFKMMVDHPTILNVLVKKELSKLSPADVDAILDSFWSGCINYDVFDLARIWGVFTVDDIEHLKEVIRTINTVDENNIIGNKLKRATTQSSTIQATVTEKIAKINTETVAAINDFTGSYVYFQNDMPNISDNKDIDSYNEYYSIFKEVLNTANGIKNRINYYDFNTPKEFIENYKNGLTGMAIPPMGKSTAAKTFGEFYVDSYNTFTTNWTNLLTASDNRDMSLKFETYASPIASAKYNEALAIRRFVSAVKELIRLGGYNLALDENGLKITDVNQCFNSTFDTANFYKKSSSSAKYNRVTITSVDHKEINPFTSNSNIISIDYVTEDEFKYYSLDYKLPNGGNCEIRVLDFDDSNKPDNGSDKTILKYYNKIKSKSDVNKTDDGRTIVIRGGLIEGCVALASFTGQFEGKNREASLVAAIVSPVAALSRCAHFSEANIMPGARTKETETEVNKTVDKIMQETKITEAYVQTAGSTGNLSQLTKRDIAQRILSKLVTEYDYFDYLDETNPGVFSSIKEKLKYFSPGFHSMTPEGLNSRLTFLQQCLRPGDTIKSKMGESCDANNTAFGKPPICMLRIGDFYHSKVVIDTINFTYDPLVYDLNPEGIGVQPMFVTVTVSFKFIGGQGLRKAVEKLQNALSFNYFGNADVYDDRTFANTDEFERSLQQFETSFFDDNELDIQRIVDNASKIKDIDEPSSILNGTIGKALTIGTTAETITIPSIYVAGLAYNPGNLVTYGEADGYPIIWNNISEIFGEELDDTTPMVGSSYWEIVTDFIFPSNDDESTISGYKPFLIPSKGLYPYQKEYGQLLIEQYKLDYRYLYDNLYKSLDYLYKRRINRYTQLSDTFSSTEAKKVIMNNPFITAGLLMKKTQGTAVENALYKNAKCAQSLLSVFGTPEEYYIDYGLVSGATFPSPLGTIDTNRAGNPIITSTSGVITVGPSRDDDYYMVGKDGEYYYKNYYNAGDYYRFGVDPHPVNENQLPQLMMLHLYPQGGNYKLPTVPAMSSGATFSRLGYPTNQFIPNAFNLLRIPKPENELDKINGLNFFKQPIIDLINDGYLSVLRRNFKNNTDENNWQLNSSRNNLIDQTIKYEIGNILVANFENNFNNYIEYYQRYFSNADDIAADLLANDANNVEDAVFTTCVKTLDALSLVLNGVDVSKSGHNFEYYEVVPNATVFDSNVSQTYGLPFGQWEKQFNYNPYKEINAISPLFVKPTLSNDFTLSLIDSSTSNTIKYKQAVMEKQDLTGLGNRNTYSIQNFDSYINSVATVFNKLDASVVTEALKFPYDYSVFQLSDKTYGIELMDNAPVNSDKLGKTKYYGLSNITVSTGTLTSNGTLLDYFGPNNYPETLSSPGTEVDWKRIGSTYKTLFGKIYEIDNGGSIVYNHIADSTVGNAVMTTVFERMGHEMIHIANKYDSAVALDNSRTFMNINSIYKQNEFVRNASVNDFLDVLEYNADTYAKLKIRPYSSYPVSTLSIEKDNFALMGLKELSQLLYFDFYTNGDTVKKLVEDQGTIIDNDSFYKKLVIKDVRTFEEIMFANLIYFKASDALKKLRDSVKHKATLAYLDIVIQNIDNVTTRLTADNGVYNGIDTLYRNTEHNNMVTYDGIKPKIMPTDTAYQLKVRKATTFSNLNKFLYKQYKPTE